MAEKDYSSEGLALFGLAAASLFKQAANILNNLDDYLEEEGKDDKKEYEAPKCTVTEIDRSKEKEMKFPKFQYQLVEDPEEGECTWTGINDDSPIDKRMKEVLDRLIFKIRINYEGKVDYIVDLEFGDIKAYFNWNVDNDRFEGVINMDSKDFQNEVFYSETQGKFYLMDDECCDCDDCCSEECCEETEEPKKEETPKESVKFDACVSNGNGAQIKCEEFSQRENTAEYLFNRLNSNMKNKIDACLKDVEIGMNRIVDYEMFTPHQNEEGVIDTISFEYSLIPSLFKEADRVAAFNEINESVVLTFIKDKFGFKDVTIDCDDIVYCTLK